MLIYDRTAKKLYDDYQRKLCSGIYESPHGVIERKEFEEYMKSIFTNDFLSQDSIEKKFVNYNGKLAVCDDYDLAQIPYFTGYVGEYYPDDFCSVRYYLKNKTEAQVNFVMIAYYNPNETYEEHDEYSYDDMNKVEYEMQLVKVGDVWRVNKYHSPELG